MRNQFHPKHGIALPEAESACSAPRLPSRFSLTWKRGNVSRVARAGPTRRKSWFAEPAQLSPQDHWVPGTPRPCNRPQRTEIRPRNWCGLPVFFATAKGPPSNRGSVNDVKNTSQIHQPSYREVRNRRP